MERESKLGRTLWFALVIFLAGYVILDFARPSILAQLGSAAVRPTQITLWVPPGEAGGEAAAIIQGAAGALELQGHPTAVKELEGGTSEAVAEFLARRQGGDLLVLTSSTLAGIAHDRHDRLVPGAAEQGLLASELLRRSRPLAVLASEPLALAVSPGSATGDSGDLIDSLRREPSQQLFAIGGNSWSRVELANLVSKAQVEGDVHFSVFPSTAEASNAVAAGTATALLATRGTVLEEVRRGQLRGLGWPFGRHRAPRFWVALAAAPGADPARLAELRRWITRLRKDRIWQGELRADGGEIGLKSANKVDLIHSPCPPAPWLGGSRRR